MMLLMILMKSLLMIVFNNAEEFMIEAEKFL